MPTDIQNIETRKRELEDKLAKESGTLSPAELKKLSAEHHDLATTLDLIAEQKQLTKAKADAEALVRDEADAELKAMAEEELATVTARLAKVDAEVDERLHPADPADQKNIVVEIRAAAGGDESALFAAELFRMYNQYAEQRGWKPSILSTNRTGIGGYKEVIFSVEGERVYSNLKFESGVHRVQRVPETEKSGRVHTSTVTVAVMPEADEVDININPKDLEITANTATGHGGQSVNTTYSAVRIVHLPTGLVVQCQDERNFQQNKQKALQVMRARLLDMERQKQQAEEASKRKSQVGTGDRSEKIRTYNVPQDRVTDHRLGENFPRVSDVLDGHLDPIIDALKAKARAERDNS